MFLRNASCLTAKSAARQSSALKHTTCLCSGAGQSVARCRTFTGNVRGGDAPPSRNHEAGLRRSADQEQLPRRSHQTPAKVAREPRFFTPNYTSETIQSRCRDGRPEIKPAEIPSRSSLEQEHTSTRAFNVGAAPPATVQPSQLPWTRAAFVDLSTLTRSATASPQHAADPAAGDSLKIRPAQAAVQSLARLPHKTEAGNPSTQSALLKDSASTDSAQRTHQMSVVPPDPPQTDNSKLVVRGSDQSSEDSRTCAKAGIVSSNESPGAKEKVEREHKPVAVAVADAVLADDKGPQTLTFLDLGQNSASQEALPSERAIFGNAPTAPTATPGPDTSQSQLHDSPDLSKVSGANLQKVFVADPVLKPAPSTSTYMQKHEAYVLDADKKSVHRLWRRQNMDNAQHWVTLSRLLENVAPRKYSGFDPFREFYLSASALTAYTGSLERNIWIEHVGNGARVEVFPPWLKPVNECKVRITGGIAAEEVAKKLQGITIASSQQKTDQRRTLASIDSVAAFHAYVRQVTGQSEARVLERSVVQKRNRFVADRLLKAFTDAHIAKYASADALRLALQYFNQHYEVQDAADLIYARCRKLELANTIAIMNLRLKHAFNWNLPLLAYKIVLDMKELGIRPNGRTWSLFYDFSANDSQRQLIVQALDRANISHLTKKARAVLALPLVEEQLKITGNNATSWKAFEQDMDSSFGRLWHSTATYKRTLNLTRQTGLDEISEELFAKVWSKSVLMRSKSDLHQYYIHVHHFKYLYTKRALGRAIKLLRDMVVRDIADINLERVIPILFLTAWQCKATNVCRTLWRFAAVNGLYDRTMQDIISQALYRSMVFGQRPQRPQPYDILSNDETEWRTMSAEEQAHITWAASAARLAVGANAAGVVADLSERFPVLEAHFPPGTSSLEMVSTWLPTDGGLREAQRGLLKAVLQQDLNAFIGHETVSLAVLATSTLQKALKLDTEWSTSGKTDALLSRKLADLSREMVPLAVWEKSAERLAKDEEIRRCLIEDAVYAGTELKVPMVDKELSGRDIMTGSCMADNV
ncbi:uncharacterized protein AB675_10335 [Cyphellophora attinorum]|uniref:Pentatricopeptide repeat domain-containing protein n=1 Tax=Cyphellophora attinorum TaxID=1664694 RepID=A0A0N0NJY9_9EURO|nr:uncharacterized protein AB675_10335 [Phialophora attinorum]KPI37438.1 hypothetical protein AB675_10335 [Phialophora attinorum]